jgi:hypothetical protein
MKQQTQLYQYLATHGGQITAKEAEEIGVSARVLRRMAGAGSLTRTMRGVYHLPEQFGDEFAALQYRYGNGIYFKDTALFLHGMIDRTPEVYEMNFPMSNSQRSSALLKTYRQNEKWYQMGIVRVKSPGGQWVRTYCVERTLCDILRKRDRTDAETIKQAMNSYAKMNGKNLLQLSQYAELFKVQDEIQAYMGVLL